MYAIKTGKNNYYRIVGRLFSTESKVPTLFENRERAVAASSTIDFLNDVVPEHERVSYNIVRV